MAAGRLTTPSATRSSGFLDDADIRPGSATSLLRTIIGCYLRRLGGWISSAALMELMTTVGVNQTGTRTAILRVRSKGILTTEVRDGRAGYALEPAALPRLARGDRRIYSPRAMNVSDRWCLISYSLPESQRQLRHQLRRRLSWIGCGTVSAALWICPEYLTREVEDILTDLEVGEEAVIFLASEPRLDGGLERAVAQWWDLPAIAARHQEFLSGYGSVADSLTPREAFASWMGCLDAWRVIPYVDPGLPLAWLPADWPGNRSIPLFADLRKRLEDPSSHYVQQVTY
ncbi:MAG TPA: PaaX family transcriptional regulator C-terminal domain-containing protein [Propionibacteriaceae bacterium]|nr:PaaX family transcriptional regulator C-terminal domain-containing protein [Propionibacteriaceae bacterium]